MSKKQSLILSLTETKEGYSVIDCAALTQLAADFVLDQINKSVKGEFSSLVQAGSYCATHRFAEFRDKKNRLLPRQACTRIIDALESQGLISASTRDFVTDEEEIGHPNIYWRLVRASSPSDVGSPHADKWFWDLGHGSIPDGYRRVKTWLPLLQDDCNPGLSIIPGSHNQCYDYGFNVGSDGRRRPILGDDHVLRQLIPAPVRCGQAVVFHDSLIHAGRTGLSPRISVEWTTATAGAGHLR